MVNRAEEAVKRFLGFNCAQAVFSAYAGDCGVPEEVALRVAAAFGGGISRCGEVCGGVSGAMMVLGLRHGSTVAGDQEGKEKIYRLGQKILARFKERHGSIRCRELLGVDPSTPEGRQWAADRGLFEELCPKLVRDAAEILAEVAR